MLQFSSLLSRSWTNYIVDIVLVLVLFLFALSCAKKGFIECFFRFVSVVVSLLVAILLSKMFVSLLDNWFNISTKFTGFFENALLKVNGFELAISNADLKVALEAKKLPAFLINLIIDSFGNAAIPEGTTLAFVVGETLSKLLVSAIAFIVLFIASLLLMKLLKKFLKLLASKIALLGAVDQLLGAVVGLIEGLVVINILLSVLALIPVGNLSAYMSNSLLAGWLYNNNVLSIILGWISNI